MPDPQIKAALIQLLDGIKRSDGEAITREMERLDALAKSQRSVLHPQLAHFLERRSYVKALAYLEEKAAQ